MLKKLAVVVIASGFAVASFAQAPAPSTAKSSMPTVAEKKDETPKPAKHVKKHHHKAAAKKSSEKAETTAPAPN